MPIRIICISSQQTGNEPLYIVDRVFITREQLNALDPNRIRKIDILKDTQATAIYGSRGANDVVIITTKRRFRTGR
ncbi:TonB-dependent receptor plug domain-containing protein [Hymenobacter sp. YC55]|nr:TonB-dependent receptor plug domain-containing protein [Hymenobacter sp. YC55]MDF7811016.1 TonB-dependent receptor plug domain-containing protein [Hymenobacter sp. YC55]